MKKINSPARRASKAATCKRGTRMAVMGAGEALCENRKQSITREKEEIYFTWRITPIAIRKNSLQDESANNLQIKDSNGS